MPCTDPCAGGVAQRQAPALARGHLHALAACRRSGSVVLHRLSKGVRTATARRPRLAKEICLVTKRDLSRSIRPSLPRQLLVAAEKEGDAEALKKLALEECLQRRLIASEDGLEDLDEVRQFAQLPAGALRGVTTRLGDHNNRTGALASRSVDSLTRAMAVAQVISQAHQAPQAGPPRVAEVPEIVRRLDPIETAQVGVTWGIAGALCSCGMGCRGRTR